MTANWAFAPVCGTDYWRVILTSPEVLIFMFFMLTDPQTVPGGRVGRVVFAACVGVASTLLLAPWTDEFGTKVGLLAGLVVMCAARPLVDRLVPQPKSETDDLRLFGRRTLGTTTRAAAAAVAVLLVGATVVVAGAPARGVVVPPSLETLDRQPPPIDPSTLPAITVSQDVVDFDHNLAGTGINSVVVTLAQNLELENQALLTRNDALLTAVSHGDRLAESRAAMAAAEANGTTIIRHYDFDNIDVTLLVPFGVQSGLSLGLHGTGMVTEDTVDGSGNVISRQTVPFDNVFAMRRATGDRWLNVGVLPPP